ncbi:MAG TPA: transposase family protein, partial [Terriglobales bacterium]|nr:transposase family protein [Terriglobales bacterium]
MTDDDNKIVLWDNLGELLGNARFYMPNEMPLQSGILHMEGWRIDAMSEYEDEYIINAEFPVAEDQTCPYCGEKEFVRFGTRNQRFHDLPVHDKCVTIWVQRQRLRCNACTKMFQQRLDYIDTKHSMTERLVLYIQRESMRRTFTSIAEQIGVNEKTVRIIFNIIADKLESRRVLKTPEWLGIDEIFLTRKSRAIFTDVGNRKPVELLPDRKKTTVAAFLRELETDKVQIVTMDMW